MESESRFVLRQLKFLLMLPITLVLILLKKRNLGELKKPFHDFCSFFFEPRITITLITVNLITYILQFFLPVQQYFFQPEHLFTLNLPPIILSWFFHANLAHLFSNMLALYIFGRIIESLFQARMLLIYFGSAFIASSVSALAGQGGIGASGAIAGLISAAILIRPFYLTYLIAGIPIPIILIGWTAILADASGIIHPDPASNIGHFAHIGGYLAITILVFILNKKERKLMKLGAIINIIFALALLLL
ncbi:MAG: rhomboid family intramembrane serine protease [Candidatus Woesearchaeota archaeon]